jgi:hypothetical protein
MSTTIQEIILQLRQPVSSLEVLEDILAAPLTACGIPTKTSRSSAKLAAPPSLRQIATLQATILAHVYPTWESQTSLPEYYFCLPKTAPGGQLFTLSALNILTAPPLSRYAVRLLDKFVQSYSLDYIWDISGSQGTSEAKWDETLRAWVSIPGKVANAVLGSHSGDQDIPDALNSE